MTILLSSTEQRTFHVFGSETTVVANYCEAIHASSRNRFVTTLEIAIAEGVETLHENSSPKGES
jgi:hypothetical protein